jgi:hypothetical protein
MSLHNVRGRVLRDWHGKLHLGVDGRLDDIVLVKVRSVGAEVSTLHA